jgi:hypothetical protein
MGSTTVWLAKPAAPRDAEGVARMRRAIEEDAPSRSLITECLKAARAVGLSGEDTYVFLAYHALLRIEEMHQSHVYLSDITPVLPAAAALAPVQPLARTWFLRQRAIAVLRSCILRGVRTLGILAAHATYRWVRAAGYMRLASVHLRRLARAALEHAWEVPRAPEPLAHVRWPQAQTVMRAAQRRK